MIYDLQLPLLNLNFPNPTLYYWRGEGAESAMRVMGPSLCHLNKIAGVQVLWREGFLEEVLDWLWKSFSLAVNRHMFAVPICLIWTVWIICVPIMPNMSVPKKNPKWLSCNTYLLKRKFYLYCTLFLYFEQQSSRWITFSVCTLRGTVTLNINIRFIYGPLSFVVSVVSCCGTISPGFILQLRLSRHIQSREKTVFLLCSYFKTFKEPRNRFRQPIFTVCSVAGRYDNPIPIPGS